MERIRTNNLKIKILLTCIVFIFASFFMTFSIFKISTAFAMTESEAKDYLEERLVENPTQTIEIVVKSDKEESISIQLLYDMALIEQCSKSDSKRDYVYWELFGTYDRCADNIINNPFGTDLHIIKFKARKNPSVSVKDEQLFNRQVEQIISTWDLKGKSDLEKLEMVYEYITKNFEYDYDALNDENGEGPAFTGAGTMKNKKGVCLGICLVFKNFCNHLDINTLLVTCSGENPNDDGHIYPIAKVGKYWTYFDPTWDLGLEKKDWQYFNNDTNIDHEIDVMYTEPKFLATHPTKPIKK